MVLGVEMKRDIHSVSKYNFTVTDSVILKGIVWGGGGGAHVLVKLIIFHSEIRVRAFPI